MTPIELDSHTKARLILALSQEKATSYQRHVQHIIKAAVNLSDNSDDLLSRLRQGQEAFADAIVVVMSELKIEPAKGNIDIVTIDQQGQYAKNAPNKPRKG